MGVILDTDGVPRAKRAHVISEAIKFSSAPCEVTHGPGRFAWARMTYVELGDGASVYNHAGSGLSMLRRSDHLRVDARQRLGLAIHRSVSGGIVLGDEQRRLEREELVLVDVTRPYEYFWSGAGGADCIQLDYEMLGVDPGLLRAAAGRLRASPLYDMVRAHVQHVTRGAEDLATDPIAAQRVTSATAHLVRALVTSAITEGNKQDIAMAPALKDRLVHWLQQHPGDLVDVEGLAAAHDLSVRQLRRAWSNMGMEGEVEEWAASGPTRAVTPGAGRRTRTDRVAKLDGPDAGAASPAASSQKPHGTDG